MAKNVAESPRQSAGSLFPNGTIGVFKVPERFDFLPTRGQGPYLYSANGTKYLDYVMGSGPLIVGHCHPAVVEAVRSQIERGSTFYYTTEQAIELAGLIVDGVPCAEQLCFTASGTETTMTALRLARAFTGKEKILKFEGAYHGWHDYAMLSSSHANGGVTPPIFPTPSVDSEGIPQAVADSIFVAPFNDIVTTARILKEHEDEIAGVIVEPIQRGIPPARGFLQELREITLKLGAVLIFDETVTGFRVRYGGAQQLYGVKPDLVCLGKIIGGGYPLGAIAGSEEILRLYAPDGNGRRRVTQFGTLSGNPVACAAGVATLKLLQRSGTYEKLDQYASKLAKGIEQVFAKTNVSIQVTYVGGMVDYVFSAEQIVDYRTFLRSNRALKREFGTDLMRMGLFTNPSARLYLSTAHKEEELKITLEAFEGLTRAYRSENKL